ncbi:DUF222 domain-containing protein [Microbacterium sp. Kw_RZR3]|uniref:HNH endonuclease signature motif containing protein n=1 Tax=Microbacterium sp. Kw_RZR3 TaxID=3032903 RepID=UPI0023D9D085|nr:HNH endonuclease signature motif containing protein [Microbacterium sp. Kw_RZR3]MDF2046940.1 DUF222 domain-containing protein [Microbacterium sp. Kw_RZR3]
MDVTAPANDRPSSVVSPWGVPWPSDDDLLADAHSAWAIEQGLFDPDPFSGAVRTTGSGDLDGLDRGSDAGRDDLSPTELLDELKRQARQRHRATAAEYRLIATLLRAAREDPVPWVGADPTLDLEWSDPRRRTVAAVRRDRRDMAERAVVAEIATRLRLSEQTVRTRAAHAEMLKTRCPEVWSAFSDGLLSERHAVEAARLATSLPAEPCDASSTGADVQVPDAEGPGDPLHQGDRFSSDGAPPGGDPGDGGAGDGLLEGVTMLPDETADAADGTTSTPPEHHESWRAFDEGALDRALRLPPARFTAAARALRERVHSESIEARHRRAARDRGVWVSPELDGMATLTALLPADRAYDALTRVDRIARHLRVAPDEERTLAQLRADAVADLLTAGAPTTAGAPSAGGSLSAGGSAPAADAPTVSRISTPSAVRSASVHGSPTTTFPPIARPDRRPGVVVTVPALTLLGAGAEPATLDGYGPIDLDTPRRLAGEASSWVRVLTHPLTGAPVALDRSTYRVPTALRRWLGVTSPTCVFPGCGRPARDCDLDHLTAWSEGGATDDENLAPECRHHHRLRHESRWAPSRDPDTGEMRWTSPLGAEVAEDPPPF